MNVKFNTILEAPVLNRSGYGQWADDNAHCLLDYNLFDLKIVPCNWGSCQHRSIHTESDKVLAGHFLREQLVSPPDVYIHQSIPHIGKPVGSVFNMCITAGLEVDRCPDNVMLGCNQWNLIVVPSKFAKSIFESSHNNVKLTKPVEVIPWSANTELYKITDTPIASVNNQLNTIPESDIYLYVGQITHSQLGMDRKDMDNLVLTFLRAFKGAKNKPALLLKTGGVNYSALDRRDTLERIRTLKAMADSDVNVYLLHGELSDVEMNGLYNNPKIRAALTFSHSEGFGASYLHATLAGKPVIAPDYSGLLEFLDERSTLLEGKLETIPQGAVSEYFVQGSEWHVVNYNKACEVLQQFHNGDAQKQSQIAHSIAKDNAERYNMVKMKYRWKKVLDNYLT